MYALPAPPSKTARAPRARREQPPLRPTKRRALLSATAPREPCSIHTLRQASAMRAKPGRIVPVETPVKRRAKQEPGITIKTRRQRASRRPSANRVSASWQRRPPFRIVSAPPARPARSAQASTRPNARLGQRALQARMSASKGPARAIASARHALSAQTRRFQTKAYASPTASAHRARLKSRPPTPCRVQRAPRARQGRSVPVARLSRSSARSTRGTTTPLPPRHAPERPIACPDSGWLPTAHQPRIVRASHAKAAPSASWKTHRYALPGPLARPARM
jgi:hypothetical protein